MNNADSSFIPRALFRKRGLVLADMPERLAAGLEERSRWCFSTRPLPAHPYGHQHYIDEAMDGLAPEYALVAHAGHGLNSSGILYFLVHGGLALFIKVAWGGAFMDHAVCTANANRAFALASALSDAAERSPRLHESQPRDRLLVVASDVSESRWRSPRGAWHECAPGAEGMFAALNQSIAWLQSVD
jgi:hypothetical protein